jgi:uncharacterized membrane protein
MSKEKFNEATPTAFQKKLKWQIRSGFFALIMAVCVRSLRLN